MVRTFRSLFFGGLAMLAAAFFAIAPASAAADRDIGIYNLTFEPPGYGAPDLMKVAAVNPEREAVPKPGDAPFDLAYTRSNQPLTTWRFAADSYSHIDPHIRA